MTPETYIPYDHLTFADKLSLEALDKLSELDIIIQKGHNPGQLDTQTANLLMRAGWIPGKSQQFSFTTLLELSPEKLLTEDGPMFLRPPEGRAGIRDAKPPGYGFGEGLLSRIQEVINFYVDVYR